MKTLLLIFVLIISTISVSAQDGFTLKEGDLLFQQSDCGPFCDAINKVTEGLRELDFNHVGILVRNEKGNWEVFEAISKGVVKTPLDSFLVRNTDKNGEPKVVVGRLKKGYGFSLRNALKKEKQFLGKGYDEIFDIENDLYYCSELVYFLYQDQDGNPLFELKPMTFIDPDTNETFDIWVDYYKELGQPIPEGKPGLNPGGISKSEKLHIFYPYSDFNLK